MLEEGVNYASLTDYRKAKGISTGGSGSEGGEGEGRILRYNSLPERDAELHEVGLLKSR